MNEDECPDCGGCLEHFDTIERRATEKHVEVKCRDCGKILDIWIDVIIPHYGG